MYRCICLKKRPFQQAGSGRVGFVSECSEFIQDLKFLNPITMLVSEAGFNGFFNSTIFISLTRCGSSGSESAVIKAPRGHFLDDWPK